MQVILQFFYLPDAQSVRQAAARGDPPPQPFCGTFYADLRSGTAAPVPGSMQPILSLDSSAPVPFVDSADAARIAARAMPVPPVEFDQAVLQTLDGRLVWLLGSMHPQRMTILLDGLSGAVLANPSTVPLCGSPGPASAASPVPCSRSP